MTSRELFQAGKLQEAIEALGGELRDNPGDARRRSFLFELLCFSGNWDRAAKQLDVLAGDNHKAEMGALLFRAALHGERTRHETFEKKDYPAASAGEGEDPTGTIDGRPFTYMMDADPRIGPRLEVHAAGAYLWIPLEHVESIEFQKPAKLRDLIWRTALVRTGPAFKATELGEVLVPALCPFSFKHPNDLVKLGRATEWEEQADGTAIPFGQKMFVVDGEDVPIMEITKIEFTPKETAEGSGAE